MSQRLLRRPVAGVALASLLASALALPGSPAHADTFPGFEGDVGVYTNGASDVMDIGDPTYNAGQLAQVQAALDPGVPFTAGSMHQSIFAKDLAAGGTDYYLDRILGVSGTSGNNVLQTRGRTLYLRGSSTWTTMGFAGSAFAGGSTNLGTLYTVTVPGQTLTEQGAQRFNAPSHAKASYQVGTTGVVAAMKKFVTYDNVAVTTVRFENSGSSPVDLTVRAASPIAQTSTDSSDELVGTRAVGNGGGNMPANTWTTATVGLKAAGFARNGTNLDREITVPAGGATEIQVTGALYTAALPDSKEAFYEYAAKSPSDAFRDGVTEFNSRWAQDIPYIDVPNPAIEKAIVYRWWGERYNSLDANEPGYVYQYPTTIEGVNLYQNSIVLTQPMHLQDTKWIRNPYLAYGQILNVGELSGSSAFLDSPGHSSWNNHYSQYLGTAGLEAYQVHGGGADLAERFAHYFEWDGKGQLEHYDGDGNKLIQYTANYMPGNDADAISFGYPKTGGQGIERPESAYVWGSFDAARQLYELSGAPTGKVEEMADTADEIRDAILGTLWNDEMKMFLARTTQGGLAATSAGGSANPLTDRGFIPARESNMYDVYAQNLIPFEDAETYKDGFRFLRYGDNFPIFPFYTANQYDRSRYSIGGSNNFSNINFTVQYRGVRSALRHYDPDHEYVTPEYASRLLDWMTWSIYPGGNVLNPNQAEYYSNWNQTNRTYNRNNQNHIMLGNMNYIFVEDMGGIQPRSDDKIELWPVDLGYEHFMVNNLRYHGKDVTIVWDPDGTQYDLGAGYALFIDGAKAFSADKLGRVLYDPTSNTVVEKDDDVTVTLGASAPGLATAVDTPIEDTRVVTYLKTAGIDLEFPSANLAADAEVSTSATQSGVRPTEWRNFHTPGRSGAMNGHPGAIAVNERPVTAAAITDGVTVNEPYWGNYGTAGETGYVELDFGAPTTFDNVKVYFMQDPLTAGHSYVAPQRYGVEVPDGSGGWQLVEDQYRSPKVPAAKLNEALFETVTTDKVRVSFTNTPGRYTAISEIQVFNSGRDVPEIVNDPPTVTVQVDTSRQGNLSTGLVATVSDDGVPEGGILTYGWETVSTPSGGAVIFTDPTAVSTTVTGTVPGTYVLRFWAEDGELRTERTIEVDLTEREVTAEFGASAAITTSGSASWENYNLVNASSTPGSSSPGAGNGWGTWGVSGATGTSTSAPAWLQYSWDSPVLLTSSDIYWYDDNGGTRRPTASTYAIEHSVDGETWTPVTLTDGSTYAGGLATNTYNHFDFEAIEASHLRIRIWGLQSGGAGTGVLRWRANGDTVDQVLDTPVLIRTGVGEIPELPESLPVQYSSGSYGQIDFAWQEITAEQVAETNTDPFVVYGTNSAYGKTVEARIYVRPEMSEGGITISSITPLAQTIEVGEQPYLPETVAVFYNDGSWDNQAIGVEWDYDPATTQEAGVYEVRGDVVVPWYVGPTAAQALLTLTVGEPEPRGDIVSSTPVTVTTEVGVAPVLPTHVVAEFENGDTENLPVTWATVAPEQYADEGTFTVTGDVDGPGGAGKAQATVTVTESSTPDTTAPSVVLTVDPADAATQWHAGTATVSVAASDDRDADPSVEVNLGDAWVDYTGPVELTNDGVHTVLARASDAAGNVSDVATATARLDATNPVSRATVDAGARTVTVAAADDTSGVERIEVKVGSAAWATYTDPVTVGAGATAVQHRAVDRAGNVEAASTAYVPRAGGDLAAATVAAVVAPTSSRFGAPVSVVAVVSSRQGTPTGEVELRIGNISHGKATLRDGRAQFRLDGLAATGGRKSLTVTYLGSPTHASASDTAPFEVRKVQSRLTFAKKPVTTTASKRAKVKVTVRGALGGAAPSGRVEARVGKKRVGSGTLNAKGVATLQLKALKVGNHKVKVTYVGGPNHLAKSANVRVKVTKGKPRVSATVLRSKKVTTSSRASVRVRLDRTAVKVRGSVVARVGGKVVARGKLSGPKGVATLRLPRLAAGKHKVVVRYQGNKQYRPATTTVQVTVKR